MPRICQNGVPVVSRHDRANADQTPRPSSTITAVTNASRVQR